MKVRVLLNIGTNDRHLFPVLPEGEHEVATEVGLKLIERGWAVALDPPKKEIKAVPPAPSIKAETPKPAAKASETKKPTIAASARTTEEKSPANKEQ